MILKIMDLNNEYQIMLERFTQLCGMNFIKKDFILNSIIKHFSNSKYFDFEENMINNIFLDTGEQLGRNYFKVIFINTRKELLDFIKIAKGSVFKEYIDNELNDYDYQSYMEEIRDLLEKVYLQINKGILEKIGNIRINFKTEELLDIIHKSEVNDIDDNPIETDTNIELLNIIIELINGIQQQNPTRILLIVKDIDHLLSKQEYLLLYDKIRALIDNSNTYFLTTISLNNYAILDTENISGVNVINDVIFQIEDFDKYKEYINDNYPINIDLTDSELLKLTNMIIQQVGCNNVNNDIRSSIMLKLIDNSLAINFNSRTNINNLEISFLNS